MYMACTHIQATLCLLNEWASVFYRTIATSGGTSALTVLLLAKPNILFSCARDRNLFLISNKFFFFVHQQKIQSKTKQTTTQRCLSLLMLVLHAVYYNFISIEQQQQQHTPIFFNQTINIKLNFTHTHTHTQTLQHHTNMDCVSRSL